MFATLIRLLGDFDLAEDALHHAFGVAIALVGRALSSDPVGAYTPQAAIAAIRSTIIWRTPRADLYRRLGRIAKVRASYQQALTFTQREPERRFLERRIASLGTEF